MTGHRKTRRGFLLYLNGTLDPGRRRVMEEHLSGCEACREAFALLAEGHRIALKLGGLEKANPLVSGEYGTPPPYSSELAEAGAAGRFRRTLEGWRMSWSLAAPRAVWILAAVVILQAALLFVSNREAIFGPPGTPLAAVSGLALDRFQILDIADVPLNAHPHIATEGYVRKVWMDAEEKTLHFMLASRPEGESPYVICEILSPDRISAPRAGSRVRVYGLARFDAQAGREWHEVNPVLDISVLKK